MTAIHQLRLSIGEGQVHARLATKFVDAFVDRALPTLSELTDEDMKLIEFVSTSRPEHPHEDEWESYEKALEAAADLQRDMELELLDVNQEALRSAFAGLHHLFERTLQYVLTREDRHYRHEILLPNERGARNVDSMLAVAARRGYAVNSDVGRDLRKLGLLANAIKHGEGRSLTALAGEFPSLFHDGPTDPPSVDLILLTPKLLQELGEAVSQFWIAFPTYGNLR